MRILLAEGDHNVAESIEMTLDDEGFIVYETDCGAEAVDLAKLYDYDLILLGDTPDLTGPDMLKSLRLARIKTPVIMYSSRRDVDSIVRALDSGADDYMVHPFHGYELVARIHAVVRRSRGHAQSIVAAGDIAVNLTTKTVTVKGKPVHVTGKEFAMLELLALRQGMTLTKEAFLNHLYGGMDEPEVKIIDVFICKLRRKLAAAGAPPDAIATIWGRGYLFGTAVAKPDADTAEVRDVMNDPPTGFVSRTTINEAKGTRGVGGQQRGRVSA